MPRDIFGEVCNPSAKLGSRAWYTVPLASVVHVLAGGAAVIVPLMATGRLPPPDKQIVFTTALPSPPAPPPPVRTDERSHQPTAAPATQRTSEAAPAEAPDSLPPASASSAVSAGPGVVGGLDVGIAGTGVIDLPAPPAPPIAAPPQPVRPGGNIKAPAKIRHVAPVYPRIAQDARVEGEVILEATIGTDGRVKDVRVLRSKPLLDRAAIDAVMEWRFTPTLLNGAPVPVLLTVRVEFALR